MRICLLWVLLCALRRALADDCVALPSLAPPSPLELPLCGNGVLDEGELCDDGNRQGSDGCNAWCSAFDRMTKPCTLAGQNAARQCLLARTMSPSQALFCRLSALGVAPDGTYLVVADGGVLVRMDLFTDNVGGSLTMLPATLIQPFVRFCSLFVLGDGTLVAHECAEQSIVVFFNGASQYNKPLVLPFRPAKRMRGLQDGDQVVVAGVPSSSPSAGTCVEVYSFNTTTMAGALLGSIECVAYNVIESGTMYPSFSLDGMVPYQITKEPCPFQMHAPLCYAVHMERSDMQIVKAFLAVDGGLDMQFSASTDDSTNVLGSPLVAAGVQSTYTLTGNCFTASHTTRATRKQPPMVALGNTCGLLPLRASWAACSQPLNNPFITDVAASSFLLPHGLSSRLRHQHLLSIFNASQLPLYRQILDNAHNGTVPIDFAELPGTRDVVYITETTIGLISTKGIVFMDLFNPGYCRATHAIMCPWGSFGSVGGVCRSCAEADTSVSAQIQCTGVPSAAQASRRLLASSSAAFQSQPFTHMGLIVSKAVTPTLMQDLANFYLLARGLNCSSAATMTEYQPYNMLADYAEARIPPPPQQLIQEHVAHASSRDGRDYSAQISEEYLVGWTTQQTNLIDALGSTNASTAPRGCGISPTLSELLSSSVCRYKINKDFHRQWLPCALGVVVDHNRSAGRRLLETDQPPVLVEHSQCTFMSSTIVSYGVAPPAVGPSVRPGTANDGGAGGGAEGSLWIIVGGIFSGLLVALLAVVVLCCVFLRRSSTAPYLDSKRA
jgi:cysteine-rich repeat protein